MDKELKILILEDRPEDAELEVRELKNAGMAFSWQRVETKDEFERALDKFQPDIILADYKLPSFDAPAALEIALNRCPDTPFIIVTGAVGDVLAIEALKKGATDYIIKDCLHKLPYALERALAEADELLKRKKVEDALRKSEARYHSSIELTNQLAWTTDSNGEVVEDIPLWRKFTGFSYEEAKGSRWTNAIHPEDAERTRQVWAKAVKDKSAYEVEFRLRRFDGVYRDFLTRGVPVFKEDGSILEWVGVNIDITERKRAREEIADLARFPSENPFPVLRIAEDGTILYSNEKGLKVLDGWGTKVGSKVPERWCRLVKERLDTGKTGQEEEEEEEEEEDKTFSITIAPIKEAGYANLYFQDITERKKAEEALNESRERYQALVDNSIFGVALVDTNHKIITVNATFSKLFNKSVSDFVGKDCFREFEKREAVCAHCPGVRAMASGKTEEVETQDVRDDGSRMYVRNRAIPLFGKEGVAKGFIEMVEDIDARKKLEEEMHKRLHELEVFYKAAVGREERIIELKKEVADLKKVW